MRGALAQVLEMDEARIRVVHSEGAGCYGHNGADDVALDAALVARARPGRPISLKWTRWDEHAWEPYGSAMLLKLQASLSPRGENQRLESRCLELRAFDSAGPRPGDIGSAGGLASG